MANSRRARADSPPHDESPGGEGPPFVSVVIPVYNDAESLVRCLEALHRQTYPSARYEVVVVDNNSDEPLEAVVRPFRQARVVHEEKQGSYAARNEGVRVAKGPVLAFTDADCEPAPPWIEKGVARLEAEARCGLVGGRVRFTYQNPERPHAAELYDSSHYLDQKKYVEQGRYAATANAFTYKRLFEEVGPFEEQLQSGGDTDWGKRVAARGYAVCYAAEAEVRHPARSSYRALRQKVLRVQEGSYWQRRKAGYSFVKLCEDMVRIAGHPVKFALQLSYRRRFSGFSGRAPLFAAFLYQGLACAARRLHLWLKGRPGASSQEAPSRSPSKRSRP